MDGSVLYDEEAFTLSLDAMQLDSPSEINLNDLPDDVLRPIILIFSNVDVMRWGQGGMDVFRLVCKRLMRVVESCATRLTHYHRGPDSLPLVLRRCMRIEHIRCRSFNLRSLEGCPNGLKSLDIYCPSLQSLEPLKGCTELESLEINGAVCISDLRPLASCTKIKKLTISYSQLVSDL